MNWWLVGIGFVVHLVFFYAIFDIYFTSPLVHGMTPQSTALPAPAHRLVLFVADGLRADRVFELDENGTTRAPYLRRVIESEGAWGISHTRVPTESRPGNVAINAGIYEDVSAVAKGWKENPVDFDSVFNESKYTWSWGSPDILPMFAKGASGDHVFMTTYPAESEDFAGDKLSELDTFVFNKVKEFIEEAKRDASLGDKFQQEKVVMFLHLLGLDTNGHAHRPYSQEYLRNIALVDRGIEETVQLIEEHFHHDGLTSYIFTSDHGMTNWGTHGAGHPSETLTPLVVWGAGIRAPKPPDHSDMYDDLYQADWKLQNVKRVDVSQADICPLMATLIGVPFPINSVGTLPLELLSGSEEFKAESIFTNARQMVAQFEVKMAQKQETTLSLLFTPYKPLTPSKKAALFRSITGLIKAERYSEAIEKAHEAINLAREGLHYYHNYDRFFLGTSIAFGFMGWMGYITIIVLRHHTPLVRPRLRLDDISAPYWATEKGKRVIFTSLGSCIALLLYLQSLPWMCYVYCLLPVVLWHKVIQQFDVLRQVLHYVMDRGYVKQVVTRAVMGILGLEIIVASFFYRELLSVGLAAMAIWPIYTPLWKSDKDLVLGWLICCFMVAAFPLMPIVGRDANYPIVCVAGIVALLMAVAGIVRPEVRIVWLSRSPRSLDNARQLQVLSALQLVVMGLSIHIVRDTASSIADKLGLPLSNQIMSWTILGLSFVLPMFSTTQVYTRMLHIAMSFTPPYLLLSTSHESVFVLALCFLLFVWLQVEHQLSVRSNKKLEEMDFSEHALLGERQRYLVAADLRCAYFFIFFLLTSFFGTGNIASINSFDPASVYCFLTVFSPFTMGTLMMWKVLIPFIFVTCTFNAIHVSVNVPTQSLFLLVLLMSDFMGLHFFFLVQDYGSWLEIGTSISHYVIVMSMICFLILLLGFSKIFTSFEWHLPPQNKRKLKL